MPRCRQVPAVESFAPWQSVFHRTDTLAVSKVLPVGEQWLYELKFNRYRGVAIKNHTSTRLYSRNGKDLTSLSAHRSCVQNLPAKFCVLDGEIVCLDAHGRPCFEDLQNYKAGEHSL